MVTYNITTYTIHIYIMGGGLIRERGLFNFPLKRMAY